MPAYDGSSDVFDQPAASASEDTQPLPAPEATGGEPSRMQTVLARFSRRFDGDFRPLLGPLDQVSQSLEGAQLPPRLRTVLPTLRDLHHQLQMLVDKVARQQAYVLIFGPLKSGKSTFMNSLCSTYVSEVTSLPAYPCLVSVSDGGQSASVVTCYDGTQTAFTDARDLHDMVLRAHGELVARIREVEAGGEPFDPALHMPQAIRRIDAKLPTPVLAESGAVLVDTPGLYSRMKFGYDRMTRDFRHAAACAIFVVKTDNLFLEQVFHEFNDLLELFSRVFLVVNLDRTKKDLSADGRLVPSLEQSNPQAIIEAFRDLTMSAPLKAAADAGRLNIYPVDLLGAASRRIRRSRGEEPRADELLEEHQDDDRFERLLGDLTDYLNSNEYMREFLGDSLRRAAGLVGEMGDLVEHEALRDLSAQLISLRDEHAEVAAQVQALEHLAGVDFAHQVGSLQESLLAGAVRHAQEIRDEVGAVLGQTIDGWFQDDSSFKSLREGRMEELLNSARDRLVHHVRGELERQASAATGGLDLPQERMGDLRSVCLDVQSAAREVLAESMGEEELPRLKSSLETAQIPVRKRFWDYVLLRSRSSVRQRLLGPGENPARPLSTDQKAARLGDPAKQKMKELAVNQLETVLETISRYNPEQTVQAYAHKLAASLNERIARLREQMTAREADLSRTLAEVEHVLSDVRVLDEHVQQAERNIKDMREEFIETSPARTANEPAQAQPPASQSETPAEESQAGSDWQPEVQMETSLPVEEDPQEPDAPAATILADKDTPDEPPVTPEEETRLQPVDLDQDEQADEQATPDDEEKTAPLDLAGLDDENPPSESADQDEDDKPIAMAEEPIALDPADGQVESQGEYESDQGDELPFRFSDTEDDDRPTA
ncbi:MAG: Dynamin family protein [Planctomycetes bacterium ADurb.Bin126]|nr:MAG: Dynamin family protein [Planctomycetes bacterium ADurb.Bin126]HOD80556.1 dynamin family protein [Phycisphaerae bacterium]HQL72397.1 dynamin family protein [Phycisphaerae bacterium]